MKVTYINAKEFFELLKTKDISMWEIFSQMIDGEKKELLFLGEEKQMIFRYLLPETQEQLEEDRLKFAKEYKDKLSKLN